MSFGTSACIYKINRCYRHPTCNAPTHSNSSSARYLQLVLVILQGNNSRCNNTIQVFVHHVSTRVPKATVWLFSQKDKRYPAHESLIEFPPLSSFLMALALKIPKALSS